MQMEMALTCLYIKSLKIDFLLSVKMNLDEIYALIDANKEKAEKEYLDERYI